MRPDRRQPTELRPIFLGPSFVKYAEGSCFVKFGDTHVICAATIEEKVPPFLRNTGAGWITAEYGWDSRSTRTMDAAFSAGSPGAHIRASATTR